MQFLMWLNDSYDNVRSQVLLLDSLPSVNKVYSMDLRVEIQREVNVIFTENVENTTMFAKSSQNKATGRGYSQGKLVNTKGNARYRGDFYGRGNGGRWNSMKSFRHCDYCNNTGHKKETCFRLHGYPEWFKDYNAHTYAGDECPIYSFYLHILVSLCLFLLF